MEVEGDRKITFTLRPSPIRASKARRGRVERSVPVFAPYAEMLPLQSGHYSYVIDPDGEIHVKRGNTSSHASMAGGLATAAGRFQVNRLGSVIEVVCGCTDFKFYYSDVLEAYLIAFFKGHPEFALNPNAVFRFNRRLLESKILNAAGRELDRLQAQRSIDAMLREGMGEAIALGATPSAQERLAKYTPPQPERLYTMQRDALITSVEEDDTDDFLRGAPGPRLGFSDQTIQSGKNNFVLDEAGWLIVGFSGHQILSGGQPVAGAGHITFEPSQLVSALDLNFSGHYRPDLSAEYVRYVYRCIATHPLIALADDCRFAGRKFKGLDVHSTVVRFERGELESDSEDLEMFLESLDFD